MADLESVETVEIQEVDKSTDSNENNKKKKKKSIFPKIILILLLLLATALGGIAYYFFDCQKALQAESEKVLFTVEENTTMYDLTDKLEKEGIIKDGKMAYYYARWKNINDIYAGQYELDKSWDLDTIFASLGDPLTAIQNNITITIPEGSWAKDIAQLLSDKLGIDYDEIFALWNDKEWIQSIMSDYPFLTNDIFENKDSRCYLEGYLAPNTYEFKEDTTAKDATLVLLDQTKKIYDVYAQEIEDSLLTTHQIFSLASIIQFEAGGSLEDQKEIAGVLYNRLASDMHLEVSASVCYAIDWNPNENSWTECETNADYDSPYNTYMYEGITPGPICNFAESCLDAAVRPNITNNYFFMADVYGDGTIYYAETFEEHAKNVETYLDGKY